jgi:hypothetical protein
MVLRSTREESTIGLASAVTVIVISAFLLGNTTTGEARPAAGHREHYRER